MRNILVTGGIGYIGSHTTVELLNNNYKVFIIDNLINSDKKVLGDIKKIVGETKFNNLTFFKIDLLKLNNLDMCFNSIGSVDVCIHFASLKAVKESVDNPLLYYDNNITGALNLIKCLKKYNCKKLIFSSSATVYGNSNPPLSEDSITGNNLLNPYGKTKYMIEEILKDLITADKSMSVILLRYFNPVGAHKSGLIGENPNGIPNNLMPYILKVLSGELEKLTIFGDDYNTEDGTCVRDYIHIEDLAEGHIKALEKINKEKSGLFIYNLGTGNGYSVLDIVNTMKKVTGKDIPFVIGKRREGDSEIVYCSSDKSRKELGWEAKRDLNKMCLDSWNYIQNKKI